MAKLQDKFFNRVIDGNLELEANEQKQVNDLAEAKAKEIIEAGATSNAKPIYFHGIELYGATDSNALEMHILNNSSTKFTSIAQVKAWAESIEGEVRIQCNGKIKVGSVWYPIILLYKGSNNQYDLYYCKSDNGNAYISNVDLEAKFETSVIDAVNKIN